MTRPYVIVGGFMSLEGKTAPANRNGRLFTQLTVFRVHPALWICSGGIELFGVLTFVTICLITRPSSLTKGRIDIHQGSHTARANLLADETIL